jgi:hypothetical protein
VIFARKSRRPPTPEQWLVAIVLGALLLLSLVLLALDLARHPPGPSRVDWPPPSQTKP